jgi:broad specificity phosphatase PhoE
MSAPVTLSPSLLDSSNATKQSLNGSGNGKKTFVGGVSMNKDDSFTSSSEGTRYSNISSTSAGYRSRLRILIVRHGETDHNVQGIIQGQLDTDLNAIGRKQAHFVAQSLANEHIDEVYSSPLKRASDTAKAIVEQNPNRKYDRMQFWYDKRLKERGFGSLEGRKYDRSKPKRDSIDGIEQTNVFCDRLASFLSDAVVRSAPFEQQTKTNSEWVDEPDSNATTYPAEDSARMQTSGPPPHLNRAGCSRTIALVAHGAAISAMVGNVLLDTGIAAMSAGVQRTRIWNCSVTEVIVNDVNGLPLLSNGKLDMKALANREGKKAFVVERWADVRHIPADLEEAAATGAANGSADEMIGRSTN